MSVSRKSLAGTFATLTATKELGVNKRSKLHSPLQAGLAFVAAQGFDFTWNLRKLRSV
jgi:hypothetical protein